MDNIKVQIKQRQRAMESIGRNGGQLALQYFRKDGLERQSKGVQDFVSEADRAVEVYIRDEIFALFPGDAILGEEGETVSGESGYSWIIDPIDGTTVFLSGLSGWVVTIALVFDENIVAGIIYDPCAEEMYSATKGNGATLNNSPLPRLSNRDISTGLVGTGFPSKSSPEEHGEFITKLLERHGNYYRDGSAASMLAKVAAGRLLALYQPHLNSWDCLAGMLLVEEVGGYVLDFDMAKMLRGGDTVLVAAPETFEQMREIINS